MDVLREREEKDNLERQLREEQKLRVLTQKRLRREKRTRRQLQEELEMENKRRVLLEESLRASGASEQNNAVTQEKLSESDEKSLRTLSPTAPSSTAPAAAAATSSPPQASDRDRLTDRIKQERDDALSGYGQPPSSAPQDSKPWGYAGMEMVNSGAATFWQNYSESLAHELEMERKSRRQQVDDEVKSPLQDRSTYYKNSIMFTSSAT